MKVLHTIGRRIICCMMVFSFIISGFLHCLAILFVIYFS